jgi:hypothetical protein
LGFEFCVVARPRTFKKQNSKPKTIAVRYFCLLLWLAFFLIATFFWVVIIEHGPENFIEGTKIEIENLGCAPSWFFKKGAPVESSNRADRDSPLRRSTR